MAVTPATAGDDAGRDERNRTAALIDRDGVAALISCSVRHVDRLSATGRMPAPMRLGVLVRWSREAVEKWIEAGCPAIKNLGK